MSTNVKILTSIFIYCLLTQTVNASHWSKVFGKSSSESEFRVNDIGTIKIVVSGDENPKVLFKKKKIEINLKSLSFYDDVDFHSGFFAVPSSSKQIHVVFECWDGESLVFAPLFLNSDSEIDRLGNLSHNGCNGS